MPALSPTVLRRSRAVNIGTFHASRRKYFGYYYGRPLLKRYIRRIHGRICVSNAARDFVSHYFPGDYRIIPNGVDVDAFRVQRPLFPELNDGKLTMLFVGRLEKRKGLVYLLHALPYVQHHFPQLRLIVVGAFDEEDMREYRQVVTELGLRDVVFKGFVSTEDKLRYYQMCDLFVSPALGRESQGIVLLEAMAAGKPVIASDIDGYRAVLRHGFEGLYWSHRRVPLRWPSPLSACSATRPCARRWAGGRRRERKATAGPSSRGSCSTSTPKPSNGSNRAASCRTRPCRSCRTARDSAGVMGDMTGWRQAIQRQTRAAAERAVVPLARWGVSPNQLDRRRLAAQRRSRGHLGARLARARRCRRARRQRLRPLRRCLGAGRRPRDALRRVLRFDAGPLFGGAAVLRPADMVHAHRRLARCPPLLPRAARLPDGELRARPRRGAGAGVYGRLVPAARSG